MNINIGDLINQTSFTHYTPNLQVRFAAPKGRVAMMLLLGDADKKAPETFDATAALNNLGWIAETELTDTQSQLAALREELSTSKRNEHNSEVAYKAAIEKQEELREENRLLNHDIASYLETAAKVCDLLGIDVYDAKHAEGKPSDVLFNHATALQQRLADAERRNAARDAEIAAQIESALRRSFNLGQVYWQQADSDSTYQQNKCDQTMETQAQHILNVLKSVSAALNPNPEAASHDE
jgi:hypothetical protein